MAISDFSFKIHIDVLAQNAIPNRNIAIYSRIVRIDTKKGVFPYYYLLYCLLKIGECCDILLCGDFVHFTALNKI